MPFMEIVQESSDPLVISFMPSDEHANINGSVHGGYLFFLCDELVFSEGVIKALNAKTVSRFMPNIILSFGGNFQERIKDLVRANKQGVSHWSIEPEGIVRDVFQCQTAMFECTPHFFFKSINQFLEGNFSSEYLKQWKKLEDALVLPEMPFTNFYVAQEFS